MLDLKTANHIVNHIIDAASKRDDLKPMTAVVIDAGGAVISAQRQDGASPIRIDLAKGKAHGAVMMGISTVASSPFDRLRIAFYLNHP